MATFLSIKSLPQLSRGPVIQSRRSLLQAACEKTGRRQRWQTKELSDDDRCRKEINVECCSLRAHLGLRLRSRLALAADSAA